MGRKDDLDEAIQRYLAEVASLQAGWRTADSIATQITVKEGMRTDGTEVGGRLRSLRRRGLVENRPHAHGYYYEWRAR